MWVREVCCFAGVFLWLYLCPLMHVIAKAAAPALLPAGGYKSNLIFYRKENSGNRGKPGLAIADLLSSGKMLFKPVK